MAPKKGSKKRPQAFHTRSDSRIKEDVQVKLLIDLESGQFASDCNPKEIVESDTSLYTLDGNPNPRQGTEEFKYVKAVTDKILNVRKLKQDNPKEYW